MRLIIFGPPGAGKGTYASILASRLKIAKISTGDILREISRQKTELGKKIAALLRKGQLVPDEFTIQILKVRINRPDAKKGFILDGFPRNVNQAKLLLEITSIDGVLNIKIPEEIIIEKLCARKICKKCGKIYNVANIQKTIKGVKFNMPPILPKKEGICDECGGELYQREDDNPETIKKRMKVFVEETKPVLDFFRNKTKIVNIIANESPEKMVEKILKKLKEVSLFKSL